MKRTLVIADIHGCLEPLRHLWEAIEPRPEDKVVFIGDYVDRGPDSKGVIDFLIGLPPELDVTFLSGNHEEKFFLASIDETELAHWISDWGGGATLESYGPGGLDDVPEEHWEFMRKAEPYFETETHIIVHANLEPEVPLAEQLPFALIHKKFGTPEPHCSGKTMVCGHTAQKSHVPLDLGHAVCIDTDPGRGGWLTCLDTESGEYWQANFEGELRRGSLEQRSHQDPRPL